MLLLFVVVRVVVCSKVIGARRSNEDRLVVPSNKQPSHEVAAGKDEEVYN